MGLLTVIWLVIFTASIEAQKSFTYYNVACNITEGFHTEFRDALHAFTVDTFKINVEMNNYHTMYSPYSIWRTLSAIAEGVDPQTQQQMFKILRLPSDPCHRQRYHQLATALIPPDDLQTTSSTTFFIDDGLKLDPDWYNYVSQLSLIDVATAPIKSNPEAAAQQMREATSAKLAKLNLSGNSVLLDSMDLHEAVRTSFPDAIVERAPFYDITGDQVGTIDLLRIRRKVRMGYMKSLNARVLQLPLGTNSKYCLILMDVLNGTDMNAGVQMTSDGAIMEAFNSLRDSAIPIDVGVPHISITSESDMRVQLEAMGLRNLWNAAEVTRSISEPPALPSSYIQRASLRMDNGGVNPPSLPPSAPLDADTGLDPKVGREFTADHPFLMGIYEMETLTCILVIAIAHPTYGL